MTQKLRDLGYIFAVTSGTPSIDNKYNAPGKWGGSEKFPTLTSSEQALVDAELSSISNI